MKDRDLSPHQRAARNLGVADGWDLAASEGRLEATDILARLAAMALFEFGENKGDWPMSLDEQGFLTALTAEGKAFDGGLRIHVWPNDHPPPHVHILKKSEPDAQYVKISLETGDIVGELPNWADRKQMKRMKALVVKHRKLFVGWWEKNHGAIVTLLE